MQAVRDFRRMTASVLLAFDYGHKRIGVATGQSVTGTASPLTVLARHGGRTDWLAIRKLIDEWRPGALVVGLPLMEDGTESDLTRSARRFGRRLREETSLPVHFADERYTSAAARSDFAELRREGAVRQSDRGRIDAVAAQRILETWLNENRA